MPIPVAQHNNSHHQSPRVIPCILKMVYSRSTSIALWVMLCTQVPDLFLVQLTLPKPQTLASGHLCSHRHQE